MLALSAVAALLALTGESSLAQISIPSMMRNNKKYCQQLTWESSPATNTVERYPSEDDANLPNSITEDIGGFSLRPAYSYKQLRRIDRIDRKRNKQRQGNTNSINRQHRNTQERKLERLKRAYNEEAIL